MCLCVSIHPQAVGTSKLLSSSSCSSSSQLQDIHIDLLSLSSSLTRCQRFRAEMLSVFAAPQPRVSKRIPRSDGKKLQTLRQRSRWPGAQRWRAPLQRMGLIWSKLKPRWITGIKMMNRQLASLIQTPSDRKSCVKRLMEIVT